jgi:hypothetical protein
MHRTQGVPGLCHWLLNRSQRVFFVPLLDLRSGDCFWNEELLGTDRILEANRFQPTLASLCWGTWEPTIAGSEGAW